LTGVTTCHLRPTMEPGTDGESVIEAWLNPTTI
jgi:hypothetical protein